MRESIGQMLNRLRAQGAPQKDVTWLAGRLLAMNRKPTDIVSIDVKSWHPPDIVLRVFKIERRTVNITDGQNERATPDIISETDLQEA